MTNWKVRAACRPFPELFFAKADQRLAVHVCLYHCPVLRDCNAWAQEQFTVAQVVGGQAYGHDGEVLGKLAGYSDVRVHNPYCRSLTRAEEA